MLAIVSAPKGHIHTFRGGKKVKENGISTYISRILISLISCWLEPWGQ